MRRSSLMIVTLLAACSALAAYRVMEVPYRSSAYWQIAENAPDVSPYNTATHNACDFSIWQDDFGMWHLVSCIRETSFPGATRLFHSWESLSLTNTMWDSSVFTNTFGTTTVTNGIFAVSDSSLDQYPGVMQAPHCFKENGLYYFFYNSAFHWDSRQGKGAWLKTSLDGSSGSFTDATNYQGNTLFYAMGRDLMIFDNRAEDGLWYSYYTDKHPDHPGEGDQVVARTASSLLGPWSASTLDVCTMGFYESPFVVKRNGWYYLFLTSDVFASQDPASFSSHRISNIAGKAAPEIIEYNGQQYVSGYGSGIHLATLGWKTQELSDADLVTCTLFEWTADPQAFDSTNTVYLETKLKTKSSGVFRFTPAQEEGSQEVWCFNASYPSGVPVTLASTTGSGTIETSSTAFDYGENRVEFRVTAADGQQKTYVIFVNRQNSDSSYSSFIVPLNMYPHIAENTAQSIGIRLSAQPSSEKTVTVSKQAGGDDDLLLTGTTQLVFTVSNWDQPQFINVEALPDADSVEGSATWVCTAPGMTTNRIVVTEREVAPSDDTDADGLPDWWEAEHSGGLYGLEASDDSDHDGFSNLQEWIAGTEPDDSNSHLKMTGISENPVAINWNGVSGRVYSIEWTTNLLNGFQTFATNLTGGVFTDLTHDAGSQVFYKIRAGLAP